MSKKIPTGSKDYRFETLAVHAGEGPCDATGASTQPIYQSASYVFDDAKEAANLFSLKEKGFIYSRITNPTVSALEEKLAALEGGTGATCVATGLAASLLALYTVMNSGDDFIASQKIYGGTCSQFRDSFHRAFGWNCKFIDPTNPDNFKKALTPKTKAIFIESVSNPENIVADMEAIARIAESAGIPLIVDNTVPTPYLCRPFEYGASIVTHSTTKYLSGHGHAMGGAVVDAGTFPWMKHKDKFPALTGSEHGYRGVVFARDFAEAPFAMHNHAVGLRDLGLTQQPMNAWLTLVGMETLPLRMEAHSRNAQKVAEYLSNHKQIAWVSYSGLRGSPSHVLAKKYMKGGMCSALFTFGVKGGYEAGVSIVENVKIFSHLANLGDTKSLIIHPASTTHAQLTDEQKILAGAGPDVVRVSIGIENPDDLIADLEQALKKSVKLAA
ncbi:MAG TPA: O-acetylhomoserine aminocarboxypropyltransferase/cysteine synthase family protein [Patescibacteria group bacterium]|nr:O-acetylhomoserine aminocarboxypropyltransferase/cysteine synthase family protein [Patescibacteria group bacterium]